MSAEIVRFLLPEIVLILAATAIYVAGAFYPARALWTWKGLAALAVAAFFLSTGPTPPSQGLVYTDLLSQYGRWLALVSGALLLLVNSRGAKPDLTSESQASLLLATTGLMLTTISADLVLLFVSLELISIPTYVLLYLGRSDNDGKEATAKYFYLSILSSAVTLYGFSFVYGLAGSTHLPQAQAALSGGIPAIAPLAKLAPLAIVLLFAGLGFKMAAAPFQFYAPDVYQGTSNANAALLSVLPKAAALIALVRLIGIGMPGQEGVGWRLAMILGVLSMTVGNVLALWQNNFRRMMAYSSIAHVGYMMVGIATGFVLIKSNRELTLDGFGAMLFYLSVYAIATIGTFGAVAFLGSRDKPIETIDDLAGAGRAYPLVGLAIGVFMFSLAGIPPLAGFWGKLTLFYSAVNVAEAPGDDWLRGWFLAFAVIGVLNAAVAAAYYLRVIGALYFRQSNAPVRGEGGFAAWGSAILAAAVVIGIGLIPGPLLRESNTAIRAARGKSIEAAPAVEQAAAPASAQLSAR